jgi:1-deoxy-D-xylulose-5-phosphate synthase
VELTVALHYVFNTPFDKIVWDVGHQLTDIRFLPEEEKNSLPTVNIKVSAASQDIESEYDAFGQGILPHQFQQPLAWL